MGSSPLAEAEPRPDGSTPPSYGTQPAEAQPVPLGDAPSRGWLLSWVFGLIALAALVLVVLHFSSIDRIIQLARAARPEWLFFACIAQAATYVCAAAVWRQGLRRGGHPRPLRSLIPLGVARLFTDQAVPSGGVSGTILVVSGLTRRRVPPPVAMATMLAGLISYDAAYLMVVLTSLGLLWSHHRGHPAVFVAVAVFALVIVAIPVAILSLKRWGNRPPLSWLSKLPGAALMLKSLADAPVDLIRSPGLLIEMLGLQLGIFLFDALTLWLAFRAIGEAPAFWIVFVSFAMASMAATIGPIPLGLGTFEAGSVGMLNFLGVPIDAALAGTLLLRGLTFWLPMLPGLWLARREIGRL